jgi:hypothetical protein
MAPANSFLRGSIPTLAAIEHSRRQLLACPGADAPPPFPLSPRASKMPAGGISALNALIAHPPQRKSGHFRCPRPSTRSLCGRAKPHIRPVRWGASTIRGHVGSLALLRQSHQPPYVLAAASKKTSGAFQLIATSLTEYANWSSTHMRIGGRCGKVSATLSAGRALGPPERSPGHGAGISSAMLGRWCG